MTLLLLLAACLAGPPATTLSGHLAHAPASADSVRLWVGFRRVSAALSPTGDFQLALPDLQAPTPTQLECGEQRTQLYLSPGDQLLLRLDYLNFAKTLTYGGRGSVANNYLAQALYQFSYGPPVPGQLRSDDFPEGTPAEVHQQATALRQARRNFLSTYAKTHPLPTAFVHDQQVFIDTQYATQLLAYARQHGDQPLLASYFDFMQEVPIREVERLSTRSLIEGTLLANLALNYTARLVPLGQLSTDPAEGERVYQLATRELGEGYARDFALRALLSLNTRYNLAGAQAFYRTYRQYNADSALARSLRSSFARQQLVDAQVAAGLAALTGNPAPGFTLTDNYGKQVSLSDFRGKVVYLDFWGTWCDPCMRQMREFAPALKKRFENCDVVFLYVSVRDAEAKWQQTLADQHFTSANSVHLRAPDEVLAGIYQVQGYPSYYLIDRNGRLLDASAPRPSDGEKTVAAIEAALKQ